MRVAYEYAVETADADDNIDGDYYDTPSEALDALQRARSSAPHLRHTFVVVRDEWSEDEGVADRQWWYADSHWHHQCFSHASDTEQTGAVIPKRVRDAVLMARRVVTV